MKRTCVPHLFLLCSPQVLSIYKLVTEGGEDIVPDAFFTLLDGAEIVSWNRR